MQDTESSCGGRGEARPKLESYRNAFLYRMFLTNIFYLFSVLSKVYSTDSNPTLWTRAYGSRADMAFSGITTFAHLPIASCLTSRDPFDIAIVGYPFDTAVSYRGGSRFGPHGIRDGSRRLRPSNGWSMHWRFNPYDGLTTIVDCGDVGTYSEME